ncbi:MAG TPA: HDOD domain-containing protein [Verrucomicrobiae bacterium]|nr:HDOD domain-containing protein [Verrucomicrobiae bacterium]
MQEIDDYIDQAEHLVPAPPILPQLIPLLNHTDVDNRRIVDLISYDTSLTANVLRVCNSAFYSRGTPIDNLLSAVTRLGSREVYQIVVLTVGAMFSIGQKSYGIEACDLWQHSVTTAVGAQLVAREIAEDENTVFTAAVLHDVGKIILSASMANCYEQFVQAIEHGASLIDAEERNFGCNHAEVGARLLERWNLPACLAVAIRHHHQPSAAGEHQRLTACVHLGNSIAYLMGYGYGDPSFAISILDGALNMLHISAERIPGYVQECVDRLQHVKNLYNLTPGWEAKTFHY